MRLPRPSPIRPFAVAAGGALIAAALAGCGGGADYMTTPAAPASTTLAGTIAVGAPMLNATISVKDAKGVVVSAAVGADGSYSGLSLAGLVAPFSLQACGFVDGNYGCFYAVVGQPGTGNVTPLTNATVALALGSDPGALFAVGGAPAPSAAALDTQSGKLRTALADLLAKAGVGAGADFATTPFDADRTGMDKILDAVKVSTGNDGTKTFVQVEGKLGSGNAFFDQNAGTGALAAGTDLDVDLRGISHVFVDGLSHAIAASDEATCVARMTASDIFDAAFALDMDKSTHVDKASGPTMICHFAALEGLLGGVFANPTLKDCDFTTDPANKVCVAGFNIIHGDVRFEGAELAVVLRTGAAWKLLGRDSAYDIHVGAAVQRSLRLDAPAGSPESAAQYTRALQFDITGSNGANPAGVRAAKVYQRNFAQTSWELTPLVTLVLTEACVAQAQASGDTPRLAIAASNGCGGSWLSLGDSSDGAGAAAIGDALIDNFYKRGRKVRIDLYDNVAMTGTPVSIVKRVEGVPPKFAALTGFPWLELDATTRSGLASYDGVAATFTAAWVSNPTVSANDVTFCLAGNCQGASRAGHVDVVLGHSSVVVPLDHKPASAASYKQLSVYGRDHDQVGISTNYYTCGGAQSCF